MQTTLACGHNEDLVKTICAMLGCIHFLTLEVTCICLG